MIAENNGKRRNVLERLQSEMEQLGIRSRVLGRGEENSPFDVLFCSHDDIPGIPGGVVGQYYFPEIPAAEDVFYFTAMVTVKEDLTDEEVKKIRERIDEINLELACGAFEIYPEIGLVYKLCYPLMEEIEEDDLYRLCDIAAAHSVVFVSSYAEKLGI